MLEGNESRMTVRIPTDLYEWLKIDAGDNHRSLNSQVIAILESHRKKTQKADKETQPE